MSVLETGDNIRGDYMLPINERLSNIHQRLGSLLNNLKKFMINVAMQDCANIHITDVLNSMEKSFAYELSFIFYIALTRRADFLPLLQTNIYISRAFC